MSPAGSLSQNLDDTDVAMSDPAAERVDGQMETENKVKAVRWCGSIRWSRWRGSSATCSSQNTNDATMQDHGAPDSVLSVGMVATGNLFFF